jgi:protein involved in polysaccharide export with SLBB domain
MKTICLLVAAALLYGSNLAAQDLSLVEPGDILVRKVVPLKEMFGHAVTKVVHVTSEGTIALPSIGEIKPLNLSVGGLSMIEVSEQLQKDYVFKSAKDKRSWVSQVVVERGTADQLLR